MVAVLKQIYIIFNNIFTVLAKFTSLTQKSTVTYLICKLLRPLNFQYDQNFAGKPVAHNLVDAFCSLIDKL